MFYPKFIYENLPYLYFIIAVYLLAFYDAWVVYASSALFYVVGAIMLVTRSSHRRVDRYKDGKNIKATLPTVIYEYLPYVYLASSVTLLLKVQIHVVQFIAFCLMILALRNIILRVNNRKKAKSFFH
ncbi:MAG: hypothetical protein ACPG52_01590 [Cognaticolwellia sp.]